MADEFKNATDVATTGGILGGISGFVRLIIFEQYGGVAAAFSIVLAAAFFGVTAAWILDSYRSAGTPLHMGLQWAIIVLSSLIARDLLAGLKSMGDQFRIDPIALATRIWGAIRGK